MIESQGCCFFSISFGATLSPYGAAAVKNTVALFGQEIALALLVVFFPPWEGYATRKTCWLVQIQDTALRAPFGFDSVLRTSLSMTPGKKRNSLCNEKAPIKIRSGTFSVLYAVLLIL